MDSYERFHFPKVISQKNTPTMHHGAIRFAIGTLGFESVVLIIASYGLECRNFMASLLFGYAITYQQIL
jgi:hypothetical protein